MGAEGGVLADIEGEGRQLYDRGPGALGLIVDNDGVSLGPRYPLVERWAGGTRVIGHDAAGLRLRTVFDDDQEPAPFVGLCRRIATALDEGNLLRAQLLGLQMPIGTLRPHHLGRLGRLAAMAKAGYNPAENRNAAGEWGFGAAASGALPMTAAGVAASWDSLAAGAAAVAETVGAGVSAAAAPVLLLAGGLLIPSSHSTVHEGDVVGHPDMTYRYDEGILTLAHADLDGGRTIVFQGGPQDGVYRTEAGQLIGRALPEGFDLAPEFLNAMAAPSDRAQAKTEAQVVADDRPQICPDPTPALESMSARSAAYQMQITGLPPGFVVRLNGIKFDGCNVIDGDMEEVKTGLQKFMIDADKWKPWFRGAKKIEDQMERQSQNSGGRRVDWFFAEPRVADFFRRRAEEREFSNISVYYVPAAVP
jgi:hypothetical protein